MGNQACVFNPIVFNDMLLSRLLSLATYSLELKTVTCEDMSAVLPTRNPINNLAKPFQSLNSSSKIELYP